MPHLLKLSAELLQCIFEDVDAADLAALSISCKSLNRFINPNRLLWKSVYLQTFDDPSHSSPEEPNWQTQLCQLVKACKILKSNDIDIKRANFLSVAKAISYLIDTSPNCDDVSINIATLNQQFESQENVDVFLCSSSLFTSAGSGSETRVAAQTEEEQQLSARLHVLCGVPMEPPKRTARPLHTYARARVYDMRKYNEKTMWGPFKDDGSGNVDWEKAETIMIVLAHNLKAIAARTGHQLNFTWTDNFYGCSANSYVSTPIEEDPPNPVNNIMQLLMPPMPSELVPLYNQPALPIEAKDPYDITGTWRRVVCFLDYTDLHVFNFETPLPPPDVPRSPIDTHEATRLITVKIYVTKIEPPGPEDGQGLPVVHFNGKSRSMHSSWDPNANSRIRGVVRQTREGEIRWTSWSIFHGEERWRSECIQVGGIRSARGVLGTWFDKDYEERGPAGPTAFWKISDHISEEDKKTGPSSVWDVGFDDDSD